MSYNAKNYTEQNGDVTHIGGKLIIEPGAVVEGLDGLEGLGGGGGCSYKLPVASGDTLGGVMAKAKTDETVEAAVDADGRLFVPASPQMAAQEDCASEEAADIKDAFNSLLSKLRASGLMATED